MWHWQNTFSNVSSAVAWLVSITSKSLSLYCQEVIKKKRILDETKISKRRWDLLHIYILISFLLNFVQLLNAHFAYFFLSFINKLIINELWHSCVRPYISMSTLCEQRIIKIRNHSPVNQTANLCFWCVVSNSNQLVPVHSDWCQNFQAP
jgi:hypothetical protein